MDYSGLHLGCVLGSLLVVVVSRADARSARCTCRYAAGTILSTGLRNAKPLAPEYARCLRERYKIDFRPVAGCLVSESLASYVNAYDSALEEATRRRFGRDVLQECADEAATKWKAQRAVAAGTSK